MVLSAGVVVLRPYKDPDRELVLTLLADPDLMAFVLEERPLAGLEAEQFLQDHFSTNEPLGFGTVCLTSTGEAVGFAGFRECRYLGADDIEFGWVIGKGHHGRGYATALGEQLIAHALRSLRLTRVLAACNPLNAASEHILRDKLNMRFERSVEPRPGFHRRVYVAAAVALCKL